MPSYQNLPLCCLGLLIACGDSTIAFAQEPEGKPQSAAASEGRSLGQVSGDIPWDTIEWVERRYKVEALRFKARDETGWDWPFSDEVMVETRDANGWTVTNEIGDIDSGDTHHFDPAVSCIIAVRAGIVVLGKSSVCHEAGEPAPFGFGVEMWEKDFSIFGFPTKCLVQDPPKHGGTHCANDGMGDDFVGRAQVDFSVQDLEAALPNVGDERIETVVLNPCRSGESVCDVTFGPDYSFTYRITRLADVRTHLHEILEEAMHKTGARSELEAIVAGLRALRAPSPRQVEPENND
jgi:hypothetical protein